MPLLFTDHGPRLSCFLRPVPGALKCRCFHHLERRVETHIVLCLLAYHLLVAIETTLERDGVFTSWATVRDTLASHHILTVVLPAHDGSVLRIRQASTSDREQRRLFAALGLPCEIVSPRRTWSHPHQT